MCVNIGYTGISVSSSGDEFQHVRMSVPYLWLSIVNTLTHPESDNPDQFEKNVSQDAVPPSLLPRQKSSDKMTEAVARLWQRPGFLVRRCTQQTTAAFEQACAELDLTARQYDYLFVLDTVGEAGQGEIGDILGLDKATNTLVLKILKRKNWIISEVVASDTRRRRISITKEGRRAYTKAKAAADQAVSLFTDTLTESEYRTFIALLQKIVSTAT